MGTSTGLIFIALFVAMFFYFSRRHPDKKTRFLAGLMCSGLILGSIFLIIFIVVELARGGITFADAAGRFLFVAVLIGYILWLIYIKGGKKEESDKTR